MFCVEPMAIQDRFCDWGGGMGFGRIAGRTDEAKGCGQDHCSSRGTDPWETPWVGGGSDGVGDAEMLSAVKTLSGGLRRGGPRT